MGFTEMEKSPFTSAVTPLVVPGTMTDAPRERIACGVDDLTLDYQRLRRDGRRREERDGQDEAAAESLKLIDFLFHCIFNLGELMVFVRWRIDLLQFITIGVLTFLIKLRVTIS